MQEPLGFKKQELTGCKVVVSQQQLLNKSDTIALRHQREERWYSFVYFPSTLLIPTLHVPENYNFQ
jgi:hypothetical protein